MKLVCLVFVCTFVGIKIAKKKNMLLVSLSCCFMILLSNDTTCLYAELSNTDKDEMAYFDTVLKY